MLPAMTARARIEEANSGVTRVISEGELLTTMMKLTEDDEIVHL
jgi:hypothetical protein